jgi:MEMO1 family protein
MTDIRPPAVAGRFYPSDPKELRATASHYLNGAQPRRSAIACMVPHAGYMYSGGVAGKVFAGLDLPKRLILIGPRHYPQGASLAIMSRGAWSTPLGLAQIDEDLAAKIKNEYPALTEDDVAHRTEHALEVEIPFLQALLGDSFQFVPIALGTDRFPVLENLGSVIARVIVAASEPIFILASSDMNHYENDQVTRVKDGWALEKVLTLDPRGLYDTVRSREISMCGYAAAVVMLTAAKALGARKAEIIAYATSGDINNDRSAVVGYAGVVVS